MVTPAQQNISFYQASVPVFIRMLTNLSSLLANAATHVQEQNIEPSEWINARLAPDMFTLARQVQSASDAAKAGAARLAGCEVPSFPDTETTFDELQARIAKTLTFLGNLQPEQFVHSGERPIVMNMRGSEKTFTGYDYLFQLAFPNLFFHVTTAYDIMRHLGLAIGKKDYLGSI
ncbi:DUF1993 domain-containing protein [Sodalis sp. dw_96]|uniref:DUF1993 domain-containing protein n=1 Tax=Sodalis sp. dw_96 TaxID=2719794 RepID=UPI001BD4956F|nr:DUF1993 domain-containing protein [Sodalis sp. dw_96]